MVILEQMTTWLLAIGARPIDILFIVILYMVRQRDIKAIKSLYDKYNLLNAGLITHAWVIRLKLGVKTLKKHRSGDVELVQPIDEIDVE